MLRLLFSEERDMMNVIMLVLLFKVFDGFMLCVEVIVQNIVNVNLFGYCLFVVIFEVVLCMVFGKDVVQVVCVMLWVVLVFDVVGWFEMWLDLELVIVSVIVGCYVVFIELFNCCL